MESIYQWMYSGISRWNTCNAIEMPHYTAYERWVEKVFTWTVSKRRISARAFAIFHLIGLKNSQHRLCLCSTYFTANDRFRSSASFFPHCFGCCRCHPTLNSFVSMACSVTIFRLNNCQASQCHFCHPKRQINTFRVNFNFSFSPAKPLVKAFLFSLTKNKIKNSQSSLLPFCRQNENK